MCSISTKYESVILRLVSTSGDGGKDWPTSTGAALVCVATSSVHEAGIRDQGPVVAVGIILTQGLTLLFTSNVKYFIDLKFLVTYYTGEFITTYITYFGRDGSRD